MERTNPANSTEGPIEALAITRSNTPSKENLKNFLPSSSPRLLSLLPASWIPYAQLMRLDRPAGFIGFYMPSLLGITYAASVAETNKSSLQLLESCIFFVIANVLIRGAACTWNDNIDQEYDRKVARCRNRPIARGAVTTVEGHIFSVAQTATLAMLFHNSPAQCSFYGILMGLLYILYPFCKRFTHFPQAILGFPLAIAIIISCYYLGVDPMAPKCSGATACLCLAEVVWTMIYDTIYAHQDLEDDIKAGVKSMAVRFKDSTKRLLTVLAVLQVALLIIAGVLSDMTLVYFVTGCAGSAISLFIMIYAVDLDVPSSCAKWFKWGFCSVGGCMAGGFLARYIERFVW